VELLPSTLVQLAELAPPAGTLLEESRERRQRQDFEGAIELVKRARDLVEAHRDPLSEAVACLHMGDLYRESGLLGPALDLARQAERASQFHQERRHRHNRAITAYLLGLLHHELCSYSEALREYRNAREHLDDARKRWVDVGRPDWVHRCEMLSAWLTSLCGCLTDLPPLGTEEVLFPIQCGDAAYAVARGKVLRYTLATEITVDGQRFQSRMRGGGPVPLDIAAQGEYFALVVPSDEWAGPDTEEGDYVLVQRERQPHMEGPGVLFQAGEGEGWVYGRFLRDAVGRVSFRPKPWIIGGAPALNATVSVDKPMGYVVAVLKPVS